MKNKAGQDMAKLRWSKPGAKERHKEAIKRAWTPQAREIARERARLLWTPEKCKAHSEIVKKAWEKRKLSTSKNG